MTKLRPDRDLQCYFFEPSAVAALSGASPSGFTVSGCWRQQFDWVVVEWNRDNVFEHPALRNLPDGDLSGLTLSYTERRTNCIPLDSTLYPTVDWPCLRIWADDDAEGNETIYYVPLVNYAESVEGKYGASSAVFELTGAVTENDYVELAWEAGDGTPAYDRHATYKIASGDTLATAAATLTAAINANTAATGMSALATGAAITLQYTAAAGANGNRVGAYGNVSGAQSEAWSPAWQTMSGGVSPAAWRVSLDFGNLMGNAGALDGPLVAVPTTNVRKLRWTWAAGQQLGAFARREFSVVVSDWTVSGANLGYQVAGYGSQRLEDLDAAVSYTGDWSAGGGNYSGGSIHWTTAPGASVACKYTCAQAHTLYLGTRRMDGAPAVTVQVDGAAPVTLALELAGEDALVRISLGPMAAGVEHTVTATHAGTSRETFYFDFLEAALPTPTLPSFPSKPDATLATDWDTLHSQAIPPERTAWLIDALGFRGRANHYAGCLWFYELARPGNVYASGTVRFAGTPAFQAITTVTLGGTEYDHLNLQADTAASVAKALELAINAGSTGVWASASGAALTIWARAMGKAGNAIALSAGPTSGAFTATASGTSLRGGVDGAWLTDLEASPRINRAARDWTAALLTALAGYGIRSTVAFSLELGNGDPSAAAGIAQRYPDGTACLLSTPSLQTNFGPQSTAFWAQVYLDMATVMEGAGVPAYLQFGEVQWWYFADHGGMPFYDAETTAAFQALYATAMHLFTDPSDDPGPWPRESAFLPGLIGTFCAAVRAAVRAVYPEALFEVLYPPQTNTGALTAVINFPSQDWTPANLACLKTEDFNQRDLNQARGWIALPGSKGFPASRAAHLVGCGDYTSPFYKEWRMAQAAGLGVVLWALDQFCLCGWNPQGEPGAQAQLV